MKTLIASAAILVATAATAFASANPDFARFGVDADQLSDTQIRAVSAAIHGSGTDSEISALVKSIVNNA